MEHKEEEEEANKNTIDTFSSDSSNPCPICLGPISHESYLDTCFHKFCYECIVHWTKVVVSKHSCQPSSLKCPLCKTENFSIILGYDGSSFQRHYINQNYGDSYFFSKAHKYRLQCYYTEPGVVDDIFSVPRFWKSRKYLQPNRCLQSWVSRELQALMQEEDVDIVVHHILGVVNSLLKRIEQNCHIRTPETIQEEFKVLVSDAARPFLTGRTNRFVSEMELFLASGLNIEAYDAVYLQRLGWNTPKATANAVEDISENTAIAPYLYIFNEDSDGND
ncbi:zf-C3HC4 domain-containing protein [Cephalotus follicularis]|uniref:Zf-C3HC4 domain-containing protein n=1 Tax=Cephalotus follicularis TaxID=3775 RepID=A0A1Q3B5A7_CEPFO|nr:zf-C3HC4 domain-containing protein [Cephalotus follicularis]